MTDDPREILQLEFGKLLLRLAVKVQAELMRRVSLSAGPKRVRRKRGRGNYTAYVTPSKPGEYLRTRTGNLRSNIAYTPTEPLAAARQGFALVGYRQNAWYGGWWEARQDSQRRKGLIDLLQEMAPQLAAMSAASAREQ